VSGLLEETLAGRFVGDIAHARVLVPFHEACVAKSGSGETTTSGRWGGTGKHGPFLSKREEELNALRGE